MVLINAIGGIVIIKVYIRNICCTWCSRWMGNGCNYTSDIIQYYSYTLRTTQKLLYLYGFPEIGSDEEGETTISF